MLTWHEYCLVIHRMRGGVRITPRIHEVFAYMLYREYDIFRLCLRAMWVGHTEDAFA